MKNLITQHQVASCQADAMVQWFNAGGMIDLYDWDLDSYINVRDSVIFSRMGINAGVQTTTNDAG